MAVRPIQRRTFLRGLGGTAIALPLLEAMIPRGKSFAQAKAPKRYLVSFAGVALSSDNGHGGFFLPNTVGPNYDLKLAFEPLAGHGNIKDYVTFVSGLKIPVGDVPGGSGAPELHDGQISALFSGVRSPTPNGRCRGVTSDQIVADAFFAAEPTTFRSLSYRVQAAVYAETFFNRRDGVSKTQMSYRRDVNNNLVGVSPISSPRLAFDGLFAGFKDADPQAQAQRAAALAQRKSVLDLVSDRTASLITRLGPADRMRMEQHFEQIREIERRIDVIPPTSQEASCRRLPDPGADSTIGAARPDERTDGTISTTNSYSDEDARAKVFCDLVHMAFACDLTRAASLMITAAQCFMNAYPLLGIREDFHNLGHSLGSQGPRAVARGVAWHMKHFAYLLAKLRDAPESDGNLLDNSAIVFLFEAGTEESHSTDKMACLVAGKAGGLKPGRHVVAGGVHPASVLNSAMKAVGVDRPGLGEINGIVPALF